uniref:Uncharacterized protein n=1 Tax=Setaria viridis TaxID=4556 RepID=A0A4U6UF43_SETVI|nr:hypothetical protein SEVIR_5G086000v2 [Setaria viridis]
MIQCNAVLYNMAINPSYFQTVDSSSVHLPCRLVTFGNFKKLHPTICLFKLLLDQLTSSLKKIPSYSINVLNLTHGVHYFFSRTQRRAVYHYVKKKSQNDITKKSN